MRTSRVMPWKLRQYILPVLAISLVAQSWAQQGSWEDLGEANVDGGADHDKIKVSSSQGTFRAIELVVQRAPIEFDRAEVHYGDGSRAPIPLAYKINAGSETRTIDLPGARRVIDSVEFWYRKGFQSSERPKVRLFGLH